jgi:two-component system, NtrC family, sensor histidine kinase HydH
MEPDFFLRELKSYVGWTEQDELELARLQAPAAQRLPQLLDDFYGAIRAHPGALAVFKDPERQIPKQRATLICWVESLLRGPYDAVYVERRMAIGRAHVKHRMPQRYMLSSMNVVRRWFADVIAEHHSDDAESAACALKAVERILDIELAVMLATYRDDLMEQMRRQERLATIGELAAGINHELKNPLAAIGASLFALQERRAVLADPRSRELTQRIGESVDRSTELITDLLSFARLSAPRKEPVAAEALVSQAVARIRLPARSHLTLDLDPALPDLEVDGAQIVQCLINLLQNAIEASPRGGAIRIRSRLTSGRVSLSIADEGEGVPVDDLERVFEPLFTTKPDGVGLGLALSRHLAEANGASLTLANAAPCGAIATLAFAG